MKMVKGACGIQLGKGWCSVYVSALCACVWCVLGGGDFSQVLLKSIFSSYCLNSLIAKKSKREISRGFLAFRRSRQNKKCRLFSAFAIWPP